MTEQERQQLIDDTNEAVTTFEDYYDVKLKKSAYIKFMTYITEYTMDEMRVALDIAMMQYDDKVEAFLKLGGILHNRAKAKNEYMEAEE